MSGKRMVHESLFNNEELAALPIEARFLYIATVVHADDSGRMRADPRYLKLKAFPFDDCRAEDVRTWRDQLAAAGGLLVVYQVEGKEYLYHPKWDKWQTLRKDRVKVSDCPKPATKRQPEDNQTTTNGQPSAAEVKEVKIREVKEVKITEGKEVKEVKEVKRATDSLTLFQKQAAEPATPEAMTARAKAIAERPFPEALETLPDGADPMTQKQMEAQNYEQHVRQLVRERLRK